MNPGASAGKVPGWDSATMASYVKSEGEFREWIIDGKPRRMGSEPKPSALISMPAYEGFLTERQVSDLVAYLKAVSGWAQSMPEEAYIGRTIAVRLGCFDCHGPSGAGGVPNPGSFKRVTPGWLGDEFKELVRNDDELREWILDGKIVRLWNNPLARRFLTRQRIQMPAYRAHISDKELERLSGYIKWLRRP